MSLVNVSATSARWTTRFRPSVKENGMNGELRQDGDQWQLRFARALPHGPEKVWRALTEAEHLQTWFPQRITGEWMRAPRWRSPIQPSADPPSTARCWLA